MRLRDLAQRELRIVFGARVTWFALAAATLLVGHSFVLAVDLYSAASRSALGFGLMRREMDPLSGIVRPLLGGLHLSATMLVPVIASRGLAIEHERRTYGALCLAAGSTTAVIAVKTACALLAAFSLMSPVVVLLGVYVALGGVLDAPETAVALGGHLLHLAAITGVALAAAAVTRSVARAATVAVLVSLASWAVDAGEGFAALAWVGRLDWASVSRQLEPFEHGIVPVGAVTWFVALGGTGYALAFLAGRIEPARRGLGRALGVVGVGALALGWTSGWHRGCDWSEQRRASLPPNVVDALRQVPGAIRLDVYLDRDDGRRAQLERDTLAKLLLARPDLEVSAPLDGRSAPREGDRNDGYGRIVVHAGSGVRETRSTSRREVSTLIFEAAGRLVPDWTQPVYSGYPFVIEGRGRAGAGLVAYLLLPGLVLAVGGSAVRIRRRP